MVEHGYAVRSFSCHGKFPMNTKREIINGVDARRYGITTIPSLGRILPSPFFFKDLLTLNYDLIHGHHLQNSLCYYAILLGKLRTKPFVYTLHDPFIASGYPFRKGLPGNIVKLCLKQSSKIIALSPNESHIIHSQFGVDNNRIAMIPNGLPLELYQKTSNSTFRQKYGLNGSIIILFVGQLEKFKGVDYLLEVARKIITKYRNVKFVIKTWNLQLLNYYQNMARRFGIEKNVLFITNVASHQDLVEMYYSCDLYVQPSLVECLSLAILEAMACSKPVIATNVGGTAYEVLDGKTGFLVEPRNVLQLEEKIVELIKSESLRVRMGKNGNERVRQLFSLDKMGRQLTKLYDEVIS